MEVINYIFLFIFGACFGSFGSVLIWRLRNGADKDTIKSILIGHSQCPFCQKRLGFGELFPILSWIFQGGKCSGCKAKISSFYPFLEICSGMVFVFTYWFVGHFLGFQDLGNLTFISNFIYLLVINYILLLLIFADLLFYELNIYLWIFLILWAIFGQFIGLVGDFKLAVIGAVAFFAMFYFIYFFSKFYVKYRFGYQNTEGFGEGDVMVAVVIGLCVPFLFGIKSINTADLFYIVFYYTILSSVLGLVFSLFSTLINRGKYGSSIPFLPAMVVGFWVLQIYGVSWVKMMLNMMNF